MDINLARTFLVVAESGSFIAAAERLHLTQTAVSARIRALEMELDRVLFIRNKAGARLTPAGERFKRYAETLVQIWERARQQVALPANKADKITLGGELSLWHPLLADWLIWMRLECPDIAVRAEVDAATRLVERVEEGSLDLAVVYSPPQRSGLVCELLMEEKLVQVTSSPDGDVDPSTYIFVDWGAAFQANHQAAFPELGSPAVSISLGPLALTFLLSVGGSGYFRVGTAQRFIDDGRLHRVRGAPEFSYSTHAVYAAGRADEALARVREGLRLAASGREKPGLSTVIESRKRPNDLSTAPR
jgi:DNA-binding transcriptional LysR family regulator